MNKLHRLLGVFFASVLVCLLAFVGQKASADVYGYQLTIDATDTGGNEIINGEIIPIQKLANGELSIRLVVTDPADPTKVVTVNQWIMGVYDQDGNKITDVVITGSQAAANAYQATLNALTELPDTYNGKTLIIKAKAQIGDQFTNEVSFSMVLGATSQSIEVSFWAQWWWVIIIAALFLLILFLILFSRKRDEDDSKKKPPVNPVGGPPQTPNNPSPVDTNPQQ